MRQPLVGTMPFIEGTALPMLPTMPPTPTPPMREISPTPIAPAAIVPRNAARPRGMRSFGVSVGCCGLFGSMD